ncbi:MAG: DUF1592 domain-containing protein [Planctomycetaceae bacterium]
MLHRFLFFIASTPLVLTAWSCTCRADEPPTVDFATLSDEYSQQIQPLVKQFCLDCHSTEKLQGELDLERFSTLKDVRTATKVWLKVAEQLDIGEMPPADAPQPTKEERQTLRDWIERYLHAEALASAGDPGPVVLRRLNNAEYTYTIRDLTGVELSPAREFPADSASGEGFTNSGNSLVMSPALLMKYLDAGKEIAGHAVLLPDGFRFSKFNTRSDWTDETLAKIKGIYRRHIETTELGLGTSVGILNLHTDCKLGQLGRIPLEKYFAATLAERSALTTGEKSIADVAAERGLNAKYLGVLWSSLNETEPTLLLDDLRTRWREAKPEDAAQLVANVEQWQRGLWTFNLVGLLGRKGSGTSWLEPVDPLLTTQPLRYAIPAPAEGEPAKDVVISLIATDAGDGHEHDFVLWRQPRLVAAEKPDILLRDIEQLGGVDRALFGKHPDGRAIDPASLCVRAPLVWTIRLPAAIAAGRELLIDVELEPETGQAGSVQVDLVAGAAEAEATAGLFPSTVTATFSQVTALYPDHRTFTFHKPILLAEESPLRERFTAALEAHRQLFPASFCYPQVVPADEVLTLIQFYREDDHLVRLLLDDEQKRQLDKLWDELRFISQDPLKLSGVLDSLVETTKGHPQPDAFDAMVEPFHRRADEFRQKLVDTESIHLEALIEFAAQAYRRPLANEEAEELRTLYRQLREEELPHEDAFRLTLARVFVALPFLYRLEAVPAGTTAAPVSAWELASRLSYFTWSSQPDAELRAAAANGTLHEPAVLAQQTRRMLGDSRIRRLASEFACQWLHIHEFDAVEVKSEVHFPEFAELRGDMYEESILFFTDLFQRDGSLLDLLDADHTFVNDRLARFYGIDGIEGTAWRRVDGIQQHGRGGILGFSTTLAKQSGASRTSPILRGNWISEVLLGEKLPRPPKNVPQLADDLPAGLTERQLIERHSSDPACAKCHQRIDAFGFALEGFDAIGRRRDKNQAGLLIDTKAKLPDGSEVEGLSGLRKYLLEKRREAVLGQFCRKLLGYALGREVQLSDQPLLDEIQESLTKDDYRISIAIDLIVQSRQFQEIRGRELSND